LCGNYQKALIHYQYSLALLKKSDHQTQGKLSDLYNNLGITCYHLKRYSDALDWWTKSSGMALSSPVETARMLMNQGNCRFHLNQFNLALDLYMEALAALPANDENFEIQRLIRNISITYLNMCQPDSALYYTHLGISRISDCQRAPFSSCEFMLLKVKALVMKEEYSEGVAVVDEILAYRVPWHNSRFCSDMDAHENDRFSFETLRLLALSEKIGIFKTPKARETLTFVSDSMLLRLALRALEQVDTCLARSFRQAESGELVSIHSRLCREAIQLGYGGSGDDDISAFQRVFYLAERIHRLNYMTGYEYIEEEDSLAGSRLFYLKELNRLKKEDLLSGASGFTDIEPAGYRCRIQSENDTLMKALGENSFSPGKPVTGIPPGNKIADQLADDEALLEYILCDSAVFILVMTRGQVRLVCQPISTTFFPELSRLKKLIASSAMEESYPALKQMYAWLIRPAECWITGKRKLYIIPDSRLVSIPFEIFTAPENKPLQNDHNPGWLIRDYEIAYHLSATGWYNERLDQMANPGRQNYTFDFSGLFPSQSPGSPAWTLTFAAREVQEIGEMMQRHGKVCTWNDPSGFNENDFYLGARRSRIIHLASHGLTDPDYPEFSGWLATDTDPDDATGTSSQNLLEPGEFEDMPLSSELMVISACPIGFNDNHSTSETEPFPGGFLFSGIKNLVFSLWDVSDRHTYEFMLKFYSSILEGHEYPAALRAAKMDLLSKPETSNPFLWAPFVIYAK
jgi:CHAT domain-containing protein/tetratricopeptide (TPR) repeat protein